MTTVQILKKLKKKLLTVGLEPTTSKNKYKNTKNITFGDGMILNHTTEVNGEQIYQKNTPGSGGIRTHAIEMTGALNQRLRPLGHATHFRSKIKR